jgi:hypothetical protein
MTLMVKKIRVLPVYEFAVLGVGQALAHASPRLEDAGHGACRGGGRWGRSSACSPREKSLMGTLR